MIKVAVANETSTKLKKDFFENTTKKFYKVMKKVVDKKLLNRDGLLDVVLVSNPRSKAMNEEYRGKKGATDIISFAYLDVTEYEQDEGDIIVGDIFIAPTVIKADAKKKGVSFEERLEYMYVHGLLHCFGYDHQTDKEEAEMEKWSKKIIGATKK